MLEGILLSVGQLTTLTPLPSYEKARPSSVPLVGSHTATAISEMITKLLDSWIIPQSRVHTVVRDNAANMVVGIEQCGLAAIGCAIHTLQLVIKVCILALRSVSDMLSRCWKIVGHYKHSYLAVERLQAIQRQLI